jgi:hypothetical protein
VGGSGTGGSGTGGDIGVGAREALGVPGEGRVLAVYRRAVYLSGPGGLAALTTMAAPPGPLHLRCAALPPCRVGERIRTDGSTVRGSRWELGLDVPTWVGSLPPPDLLPRTAVTVDRIAGYAARFGGRGPGLTPAGDDVLAGLLLVAAAGARPDDTTKDTSTDTAVDTTKDTTDNPADDTAQRPAAAHRDDTAERPSAADPADDTAQRQAAARRDEGTDRLAAVAAGVRTTTVASAFLRWAALGQCIAPAHDALTELAVQGAHASTPACARLITIGASSGSALLAGIRFGLEPNLERMPAVPLL